MEPMDEEIDAVKEFLTREEWWLGELKTEITEKTSEKEAKCKSDKENVCCLGLVAPLTTSKAELLVKEPHIVPAKTRVQSDRIRKWQELEEKRLAQMDHEEQLKILALREQAKKDIKNYMEMEQKNIAARKTTYRKNDMHIFESSSKFEWQRVVEFCDINKNTNITGKDKSRLRSIYLQLKQKDS